MVSKSRHTAAHRRGHTPVTPTPDRPSPAAERWFGYLFLIRAAAYERHIRTCAQCARNSAVAAELGICAAGLALAGKADDAEDAARSLSLLERPPAAVQPALW